MSNVNPNRSNTNFSRFFQLNEKMFLENNIQFFIDFETFLSKYQGKTIQSLTDAFVAAAKEKKFPLYYNNEYGVDADIFNWLPNARIVEGVAPKGTITMLKRTTVERDMTPTALKLPLSQAIEYMTAALKSGYFDKEWKWLVIYLTDTKDGVPLGLLCARYGGKLHLYVGKVNPDDTWSVVGGFEVGFLSNES